MDKVLLNDDFIDFVNLQIQNGSYVLEKIEKYREYTRKSLEIDKRLNKIVDKETRKLIEKMLKNESAMNAYENAFAFYLGMKQSLNMAQLE